MSGTGVGLLLRLLGQNFSEVLHFPNVTVLVQLLLDFRSYLGLEALLLAELEASGDLLLDLLLLLEVLGDLRDHDVTLGAALVEDRRLLLGHDHLLDHLHVGVEHGLYRNLPVGVILRLSQDVLLRLRDALSVEVVLDLRTLQELLALDEAAELLQLLN